MIATDDLSPQQMDDLNKLREAAQIGMDAEAFRNSPLGQWMLTNAQQQRQAIIEHLILTDPADSKAVAELQGKAVLLGLFGEWLDQAITDGQQALQFFKHYDD